VLCVVFEGDERATALATDFFEVPKTIEPLAPILTSVALQLFAYYCARIKGNDIDRPRNLAKSVTVE